MQGVTEYSGMVILFNLCKVTFNTYIMALTRARNQVTRVT